MLALLPLWLGWHRRARVRFVLPIAGGLACLLFVWQADGWAYFGEGAALPTVTFTCGAIRRRPTRSTAELGEYLQRSAHPLWPLLMGGLAGTAALATLKDHNPALSPAGPSTGSFCCSGPCLARTRTIPAIWPHHPARPGAAGRHAAAPGELPAMLGALLLLLCTLTPPAAPAMTRSPGWPSRVPGAGDPVGVKAAARNHPCPSPTAGIRGCSPCIGARACRLSRRPLGPEDLPAGGQQVWFAPAFTPSPAFGSAYRITPSPKLVDWMFVTP